MASITVGRYIASKAVAPSHGSPLNSRNGYPLANRDIYIFSDISNQTCP
jgi:hypothetical protein